MIKEMFRANLVPLAVLSLFAMPGHAQQSAPPLPDPIPVAAPENQETTPAPRIRVVLVGDSTVNDEGGWGPGFRAAFAPEVEVINLALNGRSSKSYRDEGHWQPALAQRADYILIQFGHNDCPGKGPERETFPTTTYHENIVAYVNEAREAGARPILITSIVRRKLDAFGRIDWDPLSYYAEEVRKIAQEIEVPLIDLHTLTKKQCEQLGPKSCAALGIPMANGEIDATHLGPEGRQTIGAMAAVEFAELVPEARPYQKGATAEAKN